jgi:hypothetical protein
MSTPSGESVEWALAHVALDNMLHGASHYAYQFHLKPQAWVSEHLRSSLQLFDMEVHAWRQRPIIQFAEQTERIGQTTPQQHNPAYAFLNYPPLRAMNSFYVKLLLEWHALAIYADLISNPKIGPVSPQRLNHGIEICRILTALGRHSEYIQRRKELVLFLAGVAFGGYKTNPRESEWLIGQLRKLGTYLPLTEHAIHKYEELWS